MSRIGKFSRELWVGILGIIAICIVYFLINFFKGIDVFDDTDKYKVEFTDIGEITNSAPVYINGCKVGNVSDIEYNFNEGRAIYVTISLSKGIRLPEGSYAEIHNKLMGGSTIKLTLGNGKGTIEPGATIKGQMEVGALDGVMAIMPQVEAIVPKVDSVLTSLNNVLSNPAINNTLGNIESLTAQLNTTSVQINELIANDIPVATDKLIKLEDDLLKVSAQLCEIDLQKMVGSLEASLNNIQQITTALNEGEGTAGMLLKDTTLYNRLNDVCTTAISLLEDLKANPKRYVHFSVFGKKEKK
jgi:phospholipid/cholesterol/gamma-HCH transport system substrate-binding protein